MAIYKGGGTQQSPKKIYVRVDDGVTIYAKYTFDDQNANQITDSSGNGRNLTGGTMPSYTLVSGTNYAGNFTNVSSGTAPSVGYATLSGNFTILTWVKATSNSQSYVNCLYGGTAAVDSHQYSLIWNYNSGQYEYYDSKNNGAGGDFTYRTTIMSGVSLNTRHLIGYSHKDVVENVNSTIETYADGNYVNTITGNASSVLKTFWLGSSDLGDRFKGQIGECVIYNDVISAQNVLDYYNDTKGNYGL